ncbi:MAG: protein kinase [Candidatus Methanomethylophilaceae archaeon]|nr:protein kinase [Candidatus Methanomethylophilaceae archaeon]
METNLSRWIILLLALICVVQAASAFNIKTETVYPTSGVLEPGQQVNAHYVLTYSMITASGNTSSNDEIFEFSTGLQNPSWDFTIYRDGIAIYTIKRTGYYPVLTEYEVNYDSGDLELDIQLRGTVPSSASGATLVTRIEHLLNNEVKDTYSLSRDVVWAAPTTVPTAIATTVPTATPATPIPASGTGSGGVTLSGSLFVSSTPSGANIYIDDIYRGVTPTVISGLSVGTHRVQITKSGYYDQILTTSAIAGEVTTVSATLPAISTPAPVQAYSATRDVVSSAQVESSLSLQQQNLENLKADIDEKASNGVDVSAVQTKYNAASQALTSAASASPSQASSYIATATKNMDEAKALLDKAWAEKEVATTAATIESLDGMITYFVENRSMASDPQVVAIMTKRESAVQFYSQAQDNLNAKNYPLARSKATDSQNKANEALTDANALREKNGEGINFGGNLLLYVGAGVMFAVVLSAGFFLHSRRNGRSNQNRRSKSSGARPPAGQSTGQMPRRQDVAVFPGEANVSAQNNSRRSPNRSDRNVVLPDEGSTKSTTKPEISITLSHANIYSDEWDKIGLTLANTGTAHAFDVTLTFPNDIDTRLLRPVDLAAGESTTLDVGIKPRTRGKIPLEITARYRDAANQTYKQIASFWLSVEPRGNSIPTGSPIPSSISRPVTPKSLPPEIVDRYTASEFIGKGGFARVFKVQKSDGSWAALKIPISLDAATGKSFIAELHNWTSMVHENIVRVNDYNIMPFPYFEMELCDGTLATLERPIPPDHAAWLIFNIGEGLKYAHTRGVLHRDLKPQNIMLRDGIPKISDWGLSKVMTQSGTTTVSGGFTAYYAAPEQITNKPKDQRTDIWQLGVIAYELVTGRLPFTGESMVEIGMAIATKVPERPGAIHPDAEPLDAIILKCLEKDPEKRYRSVADLQKDLAAYLKLNYVASLKESIQVNDLQRSAYYCGDLVLISLKIGDLVSAYKYAADLARYSTGEARAQAIELARQIKARVEMGAQELPEELIQKAEVVVHQVRVR